MALIIGNAANNHLIGDSNVFDLTDDIFGLDGDDWLEGRLANDALWGGNGNDRLDGGSGNDVLDGGNGNDLLIGGIGADTMRGGAGNDRYIVDNVGDSVVEAAGAGIDTVYSSISHALGANVENLTLTGGAAINGFGNALNNVIQGNNAANVLSGGAGHDSVYGLGGNDQVFGGSGNDRVDGGAGNDRVDGGSDNDVVLGGSGNDTLYGGLGNDVVQGGTGADAIHGGSGNDWLRAVDVGAGNDFAVDSFHFDAPLSAATNVDRIDRANFTAFGGEAVDDEIVLENSIFTSLRSTLGTNVGQLSATQYFEGAGLTGGGVFNLVGIYNNTTTGQLFYNPTFGVAGDSVLIATVNAAGVPGGSASLSAEEFTLV